MELSTLAIGLATGAVAGAAADRIAVVLQKKVEKRRKILEHAFGEAADVATFTMNEVTDWITERDEYMTSGCEAMVFKVNNRTLKMLNKNFNVDFGVEKYLVIAIIRKQGRKIEESVLIHYDRLNDELEGELAPGNGVMIIGD